MTDYGLRRLHLGENVIGGIFVSLCIIGILAWISAPLATVAAAPPRSAISYSAVAKPWRDVNLSFSRPGRVVQILVHRGDVVKAGQLLAEENDLQQKIAAQLAKLSANSTLRIQAAQAELAQDQVSLKRTQWAASQNAATPFEVQRAQLKVTIDQLSLKLAQLKHQHDQLAWQAAQLAVQRRKITSPFDGVIEDRYIDAGRSVNAFKKILRLVQVDRLRIFVPVPLPIAMNLHLGRPAMVTPAAGAVADGQIIWIAKVADSASNTLLVEIGLPNPTHIPAGQQVQVMFLSPAVAITNHSRISGADQAPISPAGRKMQ